MVAIILLSSTSTVKHAYNEVSTEIQMDTLREHCTTLELFLVSVSSCKIFRVDKSLTYISSEALRLHVSKFAPNQHSVQLSIQ